MTKKIWVNLVLRPYTSTSYTFALRHPYNSTPLHLTTAPLYTPSLLRPCTSTPPHPYKFTPLCPYTPTSLHPSRFTYFPTTLQLYTLYHEVLRILVVEEADVIFRFCAMRTVWLYHSKQQHNESLCVDLTGSTAQAGSTWSCGHWRLSGAVS